MNSYIKAWKKISVSISIIIYCSLNLYSSDGIKTCLKMTGAGMMRQLHQNSNIITLHSSQN
jgi:hypothetical protein